MRCSRGLRRTTLFCALLLLSGGFLFLLNGRRYREPDIAEKVAVVDENLSAEWSAVQRRIHEQISFRPKKAAEYPVKIYVAPNIRSVRSGFEEFHAAACTMRNCFVTQREEDFLDADVVLLNAWSTLPDEITDRTSQLWVLQLLESPMNTPDLEHLNGKINYTTSYRWDADFVTPYGALTQRATPLKDAALRDYSSVKSRKVAWFVSNCLTSNGRWRYVKQLSRHIDVDIFGSCVDKRVPANERDLMLRRDYKFFLAFENSNCEQYVTEKFFDALRSDVIPIVFGESAAFYAAIAPPHSFIHIDQFENALELARYLHYLDANSTAYNEYFRWKRDWRFMDTKFWCRLCSAVQQQSRPNVYTDINAWWHRTGGCHNLTLK